MRFAIEAGAVLVICLHDDAHPFGAQQLAAQTGEDAGFQNIAVDRAAVLAGAGTPGVRAAPLFAADHDDRAAALAAFDQAG
ncbi:hypothetical protein [Novosphingobium clariflavum]|uniref:Uncharacterized protein n=1 Tax=Novosphingobium clariflavum TaxID=2029884 RepID=A0ABV6S614_9SPHN|nr:hypothetical protein [Novosphingobium clariflavum]